MAYRFTDTNKWNDSWFCELGITQKALFLYLCDQCDIAGFLEINVKKISFDLGIGKQEAEKALRGMDGKIIYSKDSKIVFIKNFIKHQKNLPLNETNNAHKGIIKKLNENLQLFDFKDISLFLISPSIGANEGLTSPLGKGKGNGKEDNIITNIEKRKKIFYDTCAEFVSKYDRVIIREFYEFWTELNRSKTKMRFEMQKTFEVSKRLATWARNDNHFISIKREQPKQKLLTADELNLPK